MIQHGLHGRGTHLGCGLVAVGQTVAGKIDGDGREAGAGQVLGQIRELVEVEAEVVHQQHDGNRFGRGNFDAVEFAAGG